MNERPTSLALLLGVCCLVAMDLYVLQPVAPSVAHDLKAPGWSVGLFPAGVQLGYAIGLAVIVPLADVLHGRRLLLALVPLSVVSLVGLAAAPGLWVGMSLVVVLGLSASAVQVAVPLGVVPTPPALRGDVLGRLLGAIFAGVVLARVAAAPFADLAGWRLVLLAVATSQVLLVGAMVLRRRCQKFGSRGARGARPRARELLREHPRLRRSLVVQALTFAAWAGAWTTLPNRAGNASGVIALVGATGIVGACLGPRIGRAATHHGPSIVAAGLASAASGVVLLSGSSSPPVLVLSFLLLDAGVQSAGVVAIADAQAMRRGSESRLGGLVVLANFFGAALGSAGVVVVAASFGPALANVCLAVLLLAAIAARTVSATPHLRHRQRSTP